MKATGLRCRQQNSVKFPFWGSVLPCVALMR